MKTKEELLDREIELAYYKIASGQQIYIMDIPKVFTGARLAVSSGSTVDQAVRAAALMYCGVGLDRGCK